MPLQSGSKLGPYEIVGPIGAGGMGEVYRARDPRIGRDVAIKVLPSAFAQDTERLRRFEQEARAAGALNHPNVLSLFDIGTQDQTPYLVTELLEGATLREKLRGAALPPRKAIEYGLQIARGLAAAHDKGILHRDLKPENIFITEDGHIKILDFGLAKLMRPENLTKSNAPTTPFQTETGAVLGTVGYMSPEQVRGDPVDQRSDLFALGTILYEMLSGKRAFTGNSAVETMGAILNAEPPELASQSGAISPAFERVVFHCLEKSAAQRFQTARDLAFAIEALSASSGSSSTQSFAGVKTSWLRRNLAWSFTALACLIALAAITTAVRSGRPKSEEQIIRSSILPPDGNDFEQLMWGIPLSPDGKNFAFASADSSGHNRLWVRALDSMQARPLTDLSGNPFPFWSPDGKFIAFFSGGKLYRIDVSGGPAFPICDIADTRGGSWGRDGIILVSPNAAGSPLYQVPAGGGKLTPVTQLAPGEQGHRLPCFLPDGRHFLFVALPKKEVYVGSLNSKDRTLLLEDASYTMYAEPGYLLFAKDGSLLAQPFDEGKLKLTGEPASITPEHISGVNVAATAAFSVSQTGILAYQKLTQSPTRLVWLDRTGKQIGTVGDEGYYSTPRLSPDGKKIAVLISQPNEEKGDLWVVDVQRNQKTRLTFHTADYWSPAWSPDGTEIAYGSDWNGGVKIYTKHINGEGTEELLYQSDLPAYADSFAPDGKSLSIQTQAPETLADIWILPLTGDRKPVSFIRTPFFEAASRFSPDGRLIAYASNESGKVEIYVKSVVGHGEKYQISSDGGFNPHWRSDGKEIFYFNAKGLMSVVVTGETPFNAEAPEKLFTAPDGIQDHDVSADGQRFLAVVAVKQVLPEPITLVQNWTAVLKK